MGQLHKRFTDEQVRDMLQRYLTHEIEGPYIRKMLGLGKTQFFTLLTRYRTHPTTFSVRYARGTPPRL